MPRGRKRKSDLSGPARKKGASLLHLQRDHALDAGPSTVFGVGVDFGTCNSCVAVYDGNGRKVTAIEHSNKQSFPSTGAYNPDTKTCTWGRYIPGDAPASLQLLFDSKRFMGRTGRDGTLLQDLAKSSSSWIGILSGRRNDDGDMDGPQAYDRELRGVRAEPMIERARELLTPDATPRGVKCDDKSLYFASVEEERKAVDKGLAHLFRVLAQRKPEEMDKQSGITEELVTAAKEIYQSDVNLPEIERLVCQYFDIRAAAIVERQIVYPAVVAAGVFLLGQSIVQVSYPDVELASTPSSTGDDVIQVASPRHVRAKAVMTVPANWSTPQCRDLIAAAHLAGLDGPLLVNEPTAAAIALVMETDRPDGRYITMDIGHGTTDGAVMDIQSHLGKSGPSRIASVVTTEGNGGLGGVDFTKVVERILLRDAEASISQMVDGKVEQQQRVEQARQPEELHKKATMVKEQLRPGDPFKFTFAGIEMELEAERFFKEAKPEYEQVKHLVTKILKRIEGSKPAPQLCILFGGGSLICFLKEVIEGVIKEHIPSLEVFQSSDAKTLAAKGAAYISAGDVKVNARVPRSVGLEAHDGVPSSSDDMSDSGKEGCRTTRHLPMKVIIPKDSHYERMHRVSFTNNHDRQTSMVVSVYEGEHPIAADNSLIAQYEFDVTPVPVGRLEISVCMKMDSWGDLVVTAEELNKDDGQKLERTVKQMGTMNKQDYKEQQALMQQWYRKPNKPRLIGL